MSKTLVTGTVAAVVGLFALGGEASATTGGPLLLSQLKYDAAENKAYYLSTNTSGAGFGPSLIEYDPATQEFSTVGIDEYLLERLDEEGKKIIRFTDPEEMQEFLAGLESLPRIDLPKNNIDFVVSLAEGYDAEYTSFWPEYLQVELTARVLQDEKEIGSSSFYDCGNRIAFEGFLIPGTDELLLFVNNVGACYEGGYTVDRIVPITGFTVKDPTVLTGSTPVWEEREWPAGMISPREGTVVITVDITTEEKYARLQNFADDAYNKGEHEAAVDYLASVWFHCCFYQEPNREQEKHYPVAFELAAIQSERGEIRGYKSTISVLENLFKRLDVEERDSYKQKIIADARFTQLRDELSEEQFNALISGVEMPEEIATEEQESEAPAQQEESADEPETRQEESISFVMPAVIISVFLVGAILIFVIRKRKRSSPNTGHPL